MRRFCNSSRRCDPYRGREVMAIANRWCRCAQPPVNRNNASGVKKSRNMKITEYRNANDNVNPAKNQTFGGIRHDWFFAPALPRGGPASIGPADGELGDAATQEFSI